MIDYQGKWALITGASSGIGEAFARELAKRGTHLVLVARRKDKLHKLATELMGQYQIEVDVLPIDLASIQGAYQLYIEVQKLSRSIDILINNAGFGVSGKLQETSLEKNQDLILLNVLSVSNLTQLFLPEIIKKKNGMIINVASTASLQPTPYMSTYGASKAFVLSFTEALWAEYHQEGIHILALCPGPVDTEFFKVMGGDEALLLKRDNPQSVVKAALEGISQDKSYIIPGPKRNYWLTHLSRFVPRKMVAKISERILRPR